MTMRMIVLATSLVVPTWAAAQDMPPAGSMALSAVVTKLETDLGADLSYISEISWDDDGYWEVEYYTNENREVDIRVDPATGEIRQ